MAKSTITVDDYFAQQASGYRDGKKNAATLMNDYTKAGDVVTCRRVVLTVMGALPLLWTIFSVFRLEAGNTDFFPIMTPIAAFYTNVMGMAFRISWSSSQIRRNEIDHATLRELAIIDREKAAGRKPLFAGLLRLNL